MARTRSRFIAGAMALFAAALAGYALRPTGSAHSATLAARNPAVEVRTVVIHRTVHVVRHAHRRRGAQVSPGRRVAARATGGPQGHPSAPAASYAAAARTRTSGSHAAAAPAGSPGAPVAATTRTSGSHPSAPAPAASGPAASSRPVTTRTSGSPSRGASAPASGPGAGRPLTTRTSGSGSAHHDDGSGHGDD